MPSIDTLVEDIQALFTGHIFDPTNLEKFSDAVTEVLAARFKGYGEERKQELYLSNVGKPLRQLWYQINGTHKKPTLQSSIKLKFLYGDLLEAVLIALCIEAGHDVSDVQRKVEVDGVRGRIDCVIDNFVIDFKSASTFSFNKFKSGQLREDDPFGYIGQLSSYFHSIPSLDGAAFLAVDKTLGHLCLMKLTREEMQAYNVRDRISKARACLDNPEPPKDKCYEPVPEGKSGNLKLPIGCSYCDEKFECWKGSNGGRGLRTFKYFSGPVYLSTVVKTPNVQEVNSNS